jgi:hypothetical protein
MDTVMVKIHETDATPAAKGFRKVYFARKSTKKNPVAENEKYREVHVPEFPTLRIYNVENSDDVQPQDVFKTALDEVLSDAAGEILLDAFLANKEIKEIDSALFSFSAVVSKLQTNQTSQRLNGETIAAWYDSSTMDAEALVRYNNDADKAAKLKQAFCSLASNNSGVNDTLATKMLVYMEKQDASNTVTKAIAARLDRLSKVSHADEL